MNKKTFYITTPIYYPSGKLHIGHLYTTTIAWALKNYKKKSGYKVLFLTGIDEHGQKIEQKSITAKLSPQEYVEGMKNEVVKLWNDFEIDYDIFSRTTNLNHKKIVKNIFSTLYKQGNIYLDKYEGLYSVSDEEFLTKKQAILKDGEYYHPTSNQKLKTISEESYFLKIAQNSQWLKKYILSNNFIKPESSKKELLKNFIDRGLTDLSITRTSTKWGISPIENNKHTIYVWLDALSNYISALGYSISNDKLYKKFWQNGDEIVHIIGKEITRFHCIYWPIILKLLNVKLPTIIQSHGWITTPTGKMSKSKNNIIDPYVLLKSYDPEVIKYFLLRTFKFSRDSSFEQHKINEKYNADLANTYGNLVSRTLSMLKQNFPDMKIVFMEDRTNEFDVQMNKEIKLCFKEFKNNMDEFNIYDALESVIQLARNTNNYIDKVMPWKLANNKKRLMQILVILLNSIYAISAMLECFLPKNINKISKIFNITNFDFSQIKRPKKFENIDINDSNFVIFTRK